jgi:hypothetical protein
MKPYDWTAEEGEPYVIDAPPIPPPAPPQPCRCARMSTGSNPLCFAPHSIVDMGRLALQVKDNPRVPCILLKVSQLFQQFSPKMLLKIESDIADWADHAAKLSKKTVTFYTPHAKFPCGDKPCCLDNPKTVVQEELENYKSILGLSYKIDTAVKNAYPTYSSRYISVLIAWFTYDKPESTDHCIIDKDVADIFKISPRTVRRIREQAANDNADAFNSFLKARTLLKETKGYEVRTC